MIKQIKLEDKFDKKEFILLSLFVIFLMLKPGFGVEEWEVASLPILLTIIQNISIPLILFFLILCFFYGVLNSFKIKISISSIFMLLILTWYNIRSYQFGSNDINSIISILILVIILLYCSTFTVNRRHLLLNSALGLAFSFWLVLNFLLYLFGYGYAVNDNSMRFFGSTPHPNSCGAFALICMGYFLVQSLNKNNSIKVKYLNNFFLILSAFIIFLAGSRSAIIATILIVFLYSSNKFRALFIISLFSIISLYLLDKLPNWSIFSVLNRVKDAPIDNRNEVWGALIQDFYLNPLLGSGDYSGVSGSGYLSAFGGTGLFVGFLFILLVSYGLYKSFYNIFFMKLRENQKIFFYVLFIIVSFLSLFEGFIFDKLAFIQVLFFICFIMIGPYVIKKS